MMIEPTSGSPAAGTGDAAARGAVDRGALAREHLLAEATRIFAAKGYAAASTREICEAAGANVAAIHYYFSDKEGLYRAVLLRPIEEMTAAFGRFDDPALAFEDAMRSVFAPFVAPAGGATNERDAQVMRLHLREMLEPTAVFREIVAKVIAPVHEALCARLARDCGLRKPDTEIHQLAFALVAMANDYCMSREFMALLAPAVLNRPAATAKILDRLVGYSRALLDHEIARRQAARAATSRKAGAAARAGSKTLRGKRK